MFHIEAEVSIAEGARLVSNLRGMSVVLISKTIASGHNPVSVRDRIQKVEFLVDRTSVETYVNEGEVSSTRYVLPKGNGLSVKAEEGTATIHSLIVHPLNSAWPETISD